MGRFTLRALAGRGRRTVLTMLVVAVGVGTITGTLVYTDTISHAFHALYRGQASGASIIVTGRSVIPSDPSEGATVPARLVARIRALPGVAAAEGQINEPAILLGRSGRVISDGRLPTVALSLLYPPFGGLRIQSGHAPGAADEVLVDAVTAAQEHWRIGDRIGVVTGTALRHFTISGIAELPSSGERFVVFRLSAAQALYGEPGQVDLVDVSLKPRFSPRSVAGEIRPLLPAGVTAETRSSDVNAEVQRIGVAYRSLNDGLLGFALVTVLVGALLIFNILSITASQRTGELALLRALGATRGQVVRAVLLEAMAIGVVGSLLGIGLGPLAALSIRGVFDVAGVGLPSGGLLLRSRALWIGAATGIGATLLAALGPAVRAISAAPLEAVRSARTGADPTHDRRAAVARAVAVLILVATGLAVVLEASGDEADRLRSSAAGGGLLLLAALVAGPLAVRSLARLIARPVERRGGVIARLAREGAARQPSRTAISASSLTIGLALVLVVTVYAGALRNATRDAVRQTFVGQLAVQSADGTTPVPAASVQAAAEIPNLLAVSALSTARVDLGSAGVVQVNGIDPSSWGQVYRFDWSSGGAATLAGLQAGQILVEADTARAADLRVGSHVVLRTGGGQRRTAAVAGVYRDAGLLHGVTIDQSWFASLFRQPQLQDVFVRLSPDVSQGVAIAALQRALRRFPGVVVRSASGLASEAQRDVSGAAALVYALLVLSVLMSLIGIAGTLNLSVHERTPELGMLRALGMTAAQARALVRDESLIAAGVGSLTGIVLGLVLGWVLTRALRVDGFAFSVPWLGLLGVIAAGALSSVLAAVPPARRAARLDVLAAIAHE